MRSLIKTSIWITLLLIATANSFASRTKAVDKKAKAITPCGERPQFFESSQGYASWTELNTKGILVARDAHYWVEGKKGERLYSQQNFAHKPEYKIVCASGQNDVQFWMYAPTLIDLRPKALLPTTFWQFQLMSNKEEAGAWNRRSPIESKGVVTHEIEKG